jgi:hypothetical protein
MDDLADREELAALFRDAGFRDRDWSEPIRVTSVRRRRDTAAG